LKHQQRDREERDSPAKAMRCNARLAFVLSSTASSLWEVSARNERLHVDLNRVASVSKLVWHGPADMPQAPRRWGRAPTRRNVMPEPSKQEIDARAYQLWEKAGRPEGREDEFWHLAQQELRNEDKSSPTRTPDAL
jgi:hypothetical protein